MSRELKQKIASNSNDTVVPMGQEPSLQSLEPQKDPPLDNPDPLLALATVALNHHQSLEMQCPELSTDSCLLGEEASLSVEETALRRPLPLPAQKRNGQVGATIITPRRVQKGELGTNDPIKDLVAETALLSVEMNSIEKEASEFQKDANENGESQLSNVRSDDEGETHIESDTDDEERDIRREDVKHVTKFLDGDWDASMTMYLNHADGWIEKRTVCVLEDDDGFLPKEQAHEPEDISPMTKVLTCHVDPSISGRKRYRKNEIVQREEIEVTFESYNYHQQFQRLLFRNAECKHKGPNGHRLIGPYRPRITFGECETKTFEQVEEITEARKIWYPYFEEVKFNDERQPEDRFIMKSTFKSAEDFAVPRCQLFTDEFRRIAKFRNALIGEKPRPILKIRAEGVEGGEGVEGVIVPSPHRNENELPTERKKVRFGKVFESTFPCWGTFRWVPRELFPGWLRVTDNPKPPQHHFRPFKEEKVDQFRCCPRDHEFDIRNRVHFAHWAAIIARKMMTRDLYSWDIQEVMQSLNKLHERRAVRTALWNRQECFEIWQEEKGQDAETLTVYDDDRRIMDDGGDAARDTAAADGQDEMDECFDVSNNDGEALYGQERDEESIAASSHEKEVGKTPHNKSEESTTKTKKTVKSRRKLHIKSSSKIKTKKPRQKTNVGVRSKYQLRSKPKSPPTTTSGHQTRSMTLRASSKLKSGTDLSIEPISEDCFGLLGNDLDNDWGDDSEEAGENQQTVPIGRLKDDRDYKYSSEVEEPEERNEGDLLENEGLEDLLGSDTDKGGSMSLSTCDVGPFVSTRAMTVRQNAMNESRKRLQVLGLFEPSVSPVSGNVLFYPPKVIKPEHYTFIRLVSSTKTDPEKPFKSRDAKKFFCLVCAKEFHFSHGCSNQIIRHNDSEEHKKCLEMFEIRED